MEIDKVASLEKSCPPQLLCFNEGISLEAEVELTLKEITGATSFALWWGNQDLSLKYSLFAIILATSADEEAAKLFKSHRIEIAQISGKKCCFLYFKRDHNSPFDFAYHSQCATELIRALGIGFQEMPCILFFEEPHKDDSCLVSLKNKSVSHSIETLREIFDFLNRSDGYTVTSIQRYMSARGFKIEPRILWEKLFDLAVAVLVSRLGGSN